MSCCAHTQEEEQARQRGTKVNEEMRKHKKDLERVVKLLLLGAGESGKSTIAKQMKIIHMSGFSVEEKKAYVFAVMGNVVVSVQALLKGIEKCELKMNKSQREMADKILNLDRLAEVSDDLRQTISSLLQSNLWKKALSRKSEFYLPDSATYFFENIDRILAPEYIPTPEDILRTRIRTMGIYELSFEIDGALFNLVDVGGQRSERRKWIHCFQDVIAVLFVASLSEYNMNLEEDPSVNRMHESLQLFKEICSSEYFVKSSKILFLNKKDIFDEKIQEVDLNVCFTDYTGGLNADKACAFIQKKYRKVLEAEGAEYMFYCHVTVATNTDNIRFVFDAVRDTVFQQAIGKSFSTV